MFAANTYRIHTATTEDTDTLRELASRNGQETLEAPVLIGETDGAVAALSLSDGRVIADASTRRDHLIANLRIRAITIQTHETSPELRERLLAGLPAWYRAVAVPTATAQDEPEAVLAYAMRRA